MKKFDKQTNPGRRAFLSGTVAAAAGTTIAASMPCVVANAMPADETTPEKQEDGYRLTPHVAKYYKTTLC
jgi:hypothetical protein